MAQKTTLTSYLAQRGVKAKALTRGEAELLKIPYPLQCGWPRKYGAIEIDEGLLVRLIAHADAAHQAAEEKARRSQAQALTPGPAVQLSLQVDAAPVKLRTSPIPGFALRRARRYKPRSPAPWA